MRIGQENLRQGSEGHFSALNCDEISARRKTQRLIWAGFTLIEVMIVVGIVGIMAGIALPNLQTMVFRSRCSTEINSVSAAFRKARNTARSRHHCVQMTVAATSITLTEYDDQSGGCIGATTVQTTSFNLRYLESLNTAIAGGNPLTFTARGGTSLSTPWSMLAKAKDGQQKTIRVYPAIGAVRDRS